MPRAAKLKPGIPPEKTLQDLLTSGKVTFTPPDPNNPKRGDKLPRRDHPPHRSVLALPFNAWEAIPKPRKVTAGPGLEPGDIGTWDDTPDDLRPAVGICCTCNTVREGADNARTLCRVCGSKLLLPSPCSEYEASAICRGTCTEWGDQRKEHAASCQARLNPPFGQATTLIRPA